MTPPIKEWIRTRSGLKFYLAEPTPEMIDIRDIAFHLAGINRFTGATRSTVAQHCVVGSRLIETFMKGGEYFLDGQLITNHDLALEFLLHDAAEAYTNDLNKPLKAIVGGLYRPIADNIDRIIRAKYGLRLSESPLVKEIDSRLALTESRDLLNDNGVEWDYYSDLQPFDFTYQVVTALEAEVQFLERFEELVP